jgi:hypothetical protein
LQALALIAFAKANPSAAATGTAKANVADDTNSALLSDKLERKARHATPLAPPDCKDCAWRTHFLSWTARWKSMPLAADATC